MSRWFAVVRRVAAERDLHAPGQQLGQPPVLADAAPALGGGDRAHRRRCARARHGVHLGVVQAEDVGEHDVASEHADRLEVLGRARTLQAALGLLARLRPAVVVQRQAGAVVVGQALEGAEQVGRAGLEGERHGPRPQPAVQPAVPRLQERRRAADRLLRRVARQRDRRRQVGDAVAEDRADAGVLVGLQAGVRELGAAGIHEAHGAVLQQLDESEQRAGVLLLLGHGQLQLEDRAERAADVVREDAAHDVAVADVHVAVDEARRDDQVAGVDHALGARPGQLGGLADLADAAVLDEDAAVLDDAALRVDRDDVAGVVDLQAWGRHGPYLATPCHDGISSVP